MYKSIEELNETVRTHRRNHKLTATELEVLDVLARYSCKDIGRSFLAKSTIAELIGKSRRTIVRVCNRLELLGIIRQSTRMRQTGDRRQTSNLVEIQRAVEQPVTPACHTEESPSINPKNNNTKETAPATSGALKRSIYEPLYKALNPYFRNDDDMYKVYGILLRAKASVDRDVRIEDHSSDYIDVLKAVVFAYKQGRVRSLYGALYGSWNKLTAEISRRIKRANGYSSYDWMNV